MEIILTGSEADLVRALNDLVRALNLAGIITYSEGYNHETRRTWKLISDGSVYGSRLGQIGRELVSPPLHGSEGLRQLQVVCEVLQANGVKVNKTCGMHIHHNASDLDLGAWKRLYQKYATHEGLIDAFMPESRRNSPYYCKSLRKGRDLNSLYKEVNRARTLDALEGVITEMSNWDTNRRYHKINMQSFYRHGTVEFRHHSGTIDFAKISNWLLLTQGLVENSVKFTCKIGNMRAQDDANGLFKMIPVEFRKQMKRFYTRRAAALAGGAA